MVVIRAHPGAFVPPKDTFLAADIFGVVLALAKIHSAKLVVATSDQTVVDSLGVIGVIAVGARVPITLGSIPISIVLASFGYRWWYVIADSRSR